jgi:flavin reductase (DIM6/NTAB) family NADH-FMN oxidoreductase RutF
MKKHIDKETLTNFEQRYRANLINSIGGFKSVCLVGTQDINAKTNLAIFNSIVHIGAHPPLVGMIVRPDSVERHTLSNILTTKYYTLNHINESIYQQAHQTSARYAKDISEFEATQLTPEYKNNFFAPYVMESAIQIGVELKEQITISINDTILLIGEIQHIHLPDNCIVTDGFIDIEKAGSITCSGLDSYHTTTRIARLNYAKPDKAISISTLNYQ